MTTTFESLRTDEQSRLMLRSSPSGFKSYFKFPLFLRILLISISFQEFQQDVNQT